MARQRTLDPGFFRNEDLAELPFVGRLLFAGLWTVADREGRLEDRPKRLKADLFPYDEVDVEDALVALDDAGLIVRYQVDGHPYLSIPKFSRFQHPHPRERGSEIPAPPEIKSDQSRVKVLPSRVKAGPRQGKAGLSKAGSSGTSYTSEPSGTSKPSYTSEPSEAIVPNGTHPDSEPAEGVRNVVVLRQPPPDEQVYSAWCKAGKLNGRTIFTKERRAKVRARLAEYPPDDVADAAAGIWMDSWHVRHQRTDLIYAMRDVERFRDLRRGSIRDEPDKPKPTPGELKMAKINALMLFSQEQRQQERESELGGFLE